MTGSKPQSCDVAVVGAGPAGSAAALALAQRGLQVVLLEKASLPRYKTCGGGLLPRARRLLPPGLEAVVEREFRSVELHFAGLAQHFTATRQEPLISMVMRTDLDAALVRAAEKAGARVLASNPVRRVDTPADSVEITTDTGHFSARFLIAADGAASPVARMAGWPELPRFAPALEWEVHLGEPQFRQFCEVARFDFDVPARGYAWVFPKREHLSVGVMSTRRGGANLNAALEGYLRRLGICANGASRQEAGSAPVPALRIEKHGWQAPLAPRPGLLARGRILLAGDAAGVVDPVTGEGISNALLSGQLAAQAITDSGFDPARCTANYQALLEQQILRELQAARLLARLLYERPVFRNWIIRRSGQRLAEFMADLVLGNASYRTALLRPRSYLKAFGW